MQERKKKTIILTIVIFMLAGVALTRGISVRHRLMGHPDEFVFYSSSEILMLDLFFDDGPYEPIKPYPEGAFVFRLPFQLLARQYQLYEDYEQSVALWGRIASVFYYSVGCVLGLWIVYHVLHGSCTGAVVYALGVIFGLFQIEQSRYGTFDPVSFMLLTLIMFLCALYLRRQKEIWLMLAAFAAGAMAAGKYPLIFFFVIPLSALLLNDAAKGKKFLHVCMLGAVTAAGFILFSPSALISPDFLIKSALGGISGYVTGGNSEGFSTPPETFFSVLMYYLFYSDIPLAPIFAVFSVIKLNREGGKSAEEKLFGIVIPVSALVFLTYNIFVKTFFMRTVSQFYFIALLYAASGIGRLKKKSAARAAAFVLCALMAVRGGYLVYLLSEKGEEKYSPTKLMESVKDKEVNKAVYLGSIFYERGFVPERLTEDVSKIGTGDLYDGEYPELEPGMLVITSSLEHGIAKKCFFSPDEQMIENITHGWEKFKTDNGEYYLGSLYPEYIYRLFGFWVHGSTATNYEFPTNWLYYRPAE